MALLEDEEGILLIKEALQDSNRSDFGEAGNMVDWFSAEFTKRSNISATYQSLYSRNRVRRRNPENMKIREVWMYNMADELNQPEKLTEEIEKESGLIEGAVKSVYVNAYERNPIARKKCIEFYGSSCIVCGFNFQDFYGSTGKDYIQVHHLVPLSTIRGSYEVDPVKDLRPVCANCHAMIHRRKFPYEIQEVQHFIQENSDEVLDS